MVYMSAHFTIRAVPPMTNNYQLVISYYTEVDSIENSIITLYSYPDIYVVERTRYSIVEDTTGVIPTSQINISTTELKIGLTMNYGDGVLDNYITTGSIDSFFNRSVTIYSIT